MNPSEKQTVALPKPKKHVRKWTHLDADLHALVEKICEQDGLTFRQAIEWGLWRFIDTHNNANKGKESA